MQKMSLLYRVLFAWKCTSTHHKLAMDALRHLRGEQAETWANLFLKHVETYLDGSKAPDNKFKDFKNHVLHVDENYWGGAIPTAKQWYGRTVDCLKQKDWQKAVYSAGVLSHYYTDPICPLHTGQTEQEASIHRAAEWSFAKSYEIFQNLLDTELGGYPNLEVPSGADWLDRMIRTGAEEAFFEYDTVLTHYNLELGVDDPPAGLDDTLRKAIAKLIGHAAVGFGRILERAFDDAEVTPPNCSLTWNELLTTMTIPIFWVTRKLADSREREIVEAIYKEFQKTGRVVKSLPEDERILRELHAREVLGQVPPEFRPRIRPETIPAPETPVVTAPERKAEIPAAEKPVVAVTAEKKKSKRPEPAPAPVVAEEPKSLPAVQPGEPVTIELPREPIREETPAAVVPVQEPVEEKTSLPFAIPSVKAMGDSEEIVNRSGDHKRNLKFYLEKTRPVEAAPSIGPKTARRLEEMGVSTVADLLAQDPETTAQILGQKWITAQTVRDWQAQATLACRIPQLRGHDAQILVACGVTEPEDLTAMNAEELLELVNVFVQSEEGRRVLREGKAPDLQEIRNWIEWANHSRTLKAA